MLSEKITFKLKGLNFKKFLNLLKKENIEVFNFKKCEYNIFYVTISTEKEKQFLKITSKLNYIVQSEAHTPFLFVKNTAKRNLAFVFAIQKHMPAPFYAFDEVDASLDGINVEKLANIVQTQAESTQFIVVSHRKPMIESANRTIGVTQKEKGISKVTGVKLRD